MKQSPIGKLCVGASSGGHMAELDALLSENPAWAENLDIFVSTLDFHTAPTAVSRYVIGECNRNQLGRVAGVLYRSLRIVLKERPSIVITTGSMPLALFGLIAKLFGGKLIWIDSISQIDDISMSGKLVLRFSDLFIVQWPDLAKRYPRARYCGELI